MASDGNNGGKMVAVLLMAYGSPNNLDEVEDYFTDIRRGKKPEPHEVEELKERYRAVGGKTPLLEITQKQARALEDNLRKRHNVNAKVLIGMRHWRPYIRDAVKEISDDGVLYENVIGIVLAPHYSKMSIGGYAELLEKASKDFLEKGTKVEMVQSWNVEQNFLQAWKEKIEKALSLFPKERQASVFVIFSAHSLPERILQWNDPYPKQLMETSIELAKMLDLRNWAFAYQSAGIAGGKWLGPDILQKIEEVGTNGQKDILIAPIGFVSEHLEILYDIDIECQNLAKKLNINLKRTELLNDSPKLIDALATLVLKKIAA
jgi:ferrochelatase